MAVLDAAARLKIFVGALRFLNGTNEPFSGLVKDDVKAAVGAVDDWVDANQASFLTALPEPFKIQSTPAQKLLLLVAVVTMRHSEALARRFFGGLE